MHIQKGLDLHQNGTCTWIYEDPSFKDWYNADKKKTIWYHADAGAGKTVLSSVLSKYLEEQGLKTAYFSYSFSDPYRREPISAIRSLALEVLKQTDTVPDKVLSLYETEMANFALTLRDLNVAIAVLQALLKQTSQIHVIADGLDECLDTSIMSRAFAQLVSADTLGIVIWFLTSRHDYFAQNLAKQVNAIEMIPGSKVIMGDIKLYLHNSLLAHGHATSCINQWTAASNGNFLWISFMLRTLTAVDLTCDEDIAEELGRFPKGLTGFYLRTLEKLALRTGLHQELARYFSLSKVLLLVLTVLEERFLRYW